MPHPLPLNPTQGPVACKLLQPVAKPNRKCCVNGKVESGALKFFFFGSESSLSWSYYILHWNTQAKDHAVFPLCLIHSSGRTQAQRDFRRLKISSLVFATGAIF